MKKIFVLSWLIFGAVLLSSCTKPETETPASSETETVAPAVPVTEAVTETEPETVAPETEPETEAVTEAETGEASEKLIKDVPLKKEEETTEAVSEPEDGLPENPLYEQFVNAYADQTMPDYSRIPVVPHDYEMPSPYQSVNLANLQGRWVNEYTDSDGTKVKEVLTVNGTHGKIETYQNGEQRGVWNGEGEVFLEDRSYKNVCPAFRLVRDGESFCTIYIRWVKDDSFYDGGFTVEWKREPADPGWLTETVNLEMLQGVWYCESLEDDVLCQDVLTVEGNRGTIFSTRDGEVTPYWNLQGIASVTVTNMDRMDETVPEFLLSDDSMQSAGIGIYITSVDANCFYDRGLGRWWIRIPETGYQEYLEGAVPYGDTTVKTWRYTLAITPEDKEDVHKKWRVDVTGGYGTDAAFSVEIDPESAYFPSAEEVVLEDDVNFDGMSDLLFFNRAYGTKNAVYYDCFLGVGNGFVRCTGFEGIPDPVIDRESGKIYSTLPDGPDKVIRSTYQVKGSGVELEKEETYNISL